MMDPTLELLSNKVEQKRKEVLESIGEGAAKDYAHYQSAVGYMRAMATVQSFILEVQQRLDGNDE